MDEINLNHPKNDNGLQVARHPRWLKWLIIFGVAVVALAIAIVVAIKWYEAQLRPVDESNDQRVSVVIKDGESVADIAARLKESGLIRNRRAFEIYARLNNKANLKASTCIFRQSESVEQIVERLNAGCHDFKIITFYPGGTLESSLYKASRSSDGIDKTSVRYVLQQAGFDDGEITEAFNAKYEGELFADKPQNASLEGYIFGETYHVSEDATAKEVLETVFAHMNEVAKKNDLATKFKNQGLSLYEGLTLASIVERELTCEDKPTSERKERCYQYQRGIAQVFIKRYKTGMQLGSDVTAIYAADSENVKISENDTATLLAVDSRYNTRKYSGLPPTPIAAPGELALKAVADPTDTENLFFLAGDDGLIYFAKTDEEHQQNIEKYCQKLCNII